MGEYHSNIATQASPNQRNKNVAFGNKQKERREHHCCRLSKSN